MTESKARVPARITWAVNSLPVSGGDRVLEIGCGRGIALGLLCERMRTGRVTGLDRSAPAAAAAATRNATHLASGRLRLLEGALATATLDGPYDLVFAVNVNVFWLRPARELAAIRRCLRPDGRLCLFYEPPGAVQARRILDACPRALREGGFSVLEASRVDPPPLLGVAIIAVAIIASASA
jgi:SAM-dependent methyltransferase